MYCTAHKYSHFLKIIEEVRECTRNNPSVAVLFNATRNGKGLARACLTISENCSIVAFEGTDKKGHQCHVWKAIQN